MFARECGVVDCTPKKTFTINNVQLPTHFFPEGAIINKLHTSSESFGAVEAGTMTNYWRKGDGIAVYNISRYRNERRAEKFMDAALNHREEYKQHPQLSFHSSIADEYEVGCGISRFWGYRCDLDARYAQYVLSFNTIIDEEMTLEKFEKIIRYLDDEMTRQLSPDGIE